jgi:hypothetical protein
VKWVVKKRVPHLHPKVPPFFLKSLQIKPVPVEHRAFYLPVIHPSPMCWVCDLTAPRCGWCEAENVEDHFAGWGTHYRTLSRDDFVILGLEDLWDCDWEEVPKAASPPAPQLPPVPDVRREIGACISRLSGPSGRGMTWNEPKHSVCCRSQSKFHCHFQRRRGARRRRFHGFCHILRCRTHRRSFSSR